MRNSLRLFGLLAVLAGVNVYVFFFNRGTAPREVLKPSSLVKTADGTAGLVKESSAASSAALALKSPGSATDESPSRDKSSSAKAGLPSPLATAKPETKVATKTAVASGGGGPPKGPPGGSPGRDDGESVHSHAGSPENSSSENRSSDKSNPGNSGAENGAEGGGAEKKIGDADTLGQVLAREGFDDDAPRVIAALTRLFDPKLIRGGQTYSVREDDDGEPEVFEYRPNAVTRFVVARGANRAWTAVRVDQALETKIVALSGTIDSSLYESVQSAGETSALAGMLVDLLAWDVNFYSDTQPGDHFKVIVEKQILAGHFYRYGHILAAEYGGKVGTFRAFFWKPNRSDAPGRYFDDKGRAISKTLLKTPLRFVRISSKFDRHRFHPILHRERAHLGIDYAAPAGTPVWASSGGKVLLCEMKSGSGNTVVIAHGNGMTTRYYHLKRFARGLHQGQAVKQKQVIGYVGTTGLSTGPHLHFSVTVNGAFVDPSKVQVNRDPPVAERGAYLAAIKQRLATLTALPPPDPLARN